MRQHRCQHACPEPGGYLLKQGGGLDSRQGFEHLGSLRGVATHKGLAERVIPVLAHVWTTQGLSWRVISTIASSW